MRFLRLTGEEGVSLGRMFVNDDCYELYQEDRPTPAQELESIQGFSIVRNRFQVPENFACVVGEFRLKALLENSGFSDREGSETSTHVHEIFHLLLQRNLSRKTFHRAGTVKAIDFRQAIQHILRVVRHGDWAAVAEDKNI